MTTVTRAYNMICGDINTLGRIIKCPAKLDLARIGVHRAHDLRVLLLGYAVHLLLILGTRGGVYKTRASRTDHKNINYLLKPKKRWKKKIG